LPPVSLRLGGEGPATAWRGRLQANAGSARLDGSLTMAVEEALTLDLSAHAQDAGQLAPSFGAYVPPAVDVVSRLQWHPGKRLDVQQLSLAAPEATARLSGSLDFDAGRVQGSVDMTVADAARWQALLAPAALRAAHVAGSIAGALDQPNFELEMTTDGLTVPDVAAAHVEGKVTGHATVENGHLVTGLSVAGEGKASGLIVARAP